MQGCDLIGIMETFCGGSCDWSIGMEWNDTDSLGRTSRGDEEAVSPSISMTCWSEGLPGNG